jgi:arsenite methyltransferase
MIVQDPIDGEKIRKEVREQYGRMAERAGISPGACCCSPSPDTTGLIYDIPEVGELPVEVRSLSAGCGDPVTLAALELGQVVLDLGSGGGIDCFLAAQRVGESGYVIGVDMTAEMLAQARANKKRVGLDNVEFRLGEIEHLPVADNSVDVIISNCVINLSVDKPQVFREAFRVLKPGGKLAVSDIVADGLLPRAMEANLAAWAGCLAGALDKEVFIEALQEAGFVDVEISARMPDPERASDWLAAEGAELPDPGLCGQPTVMIQIDGEWQAVELGDRKPPFSARITARKP